ncbi:hypothetical protein HO997_04665 [Streptococcus suis]|nr:hypothetical protein [Streptococcus suis]
MKKFFGLFFIVCSFVLFMGCGRTTQKEKTYDDDFVKSLAKGLDNRWALSDSVEFEESATNYKKIIQKELDEVQEYTDKKFSSSQLQEQALAYINELKSGLEIAETYGADSFYTEWMNHTNRRTSILLSIQSIKEIPVKDTGILEELLAKGKEATQLNEKETAVKNLVSNLTYTLDESKSNEYSKYYFVEVENTTPYLIKDIGLSVNLINDAGVIVETTYISSSNWKPGTKVRMEFIVGDTEFTTTETTIEYYNAE